MKPSNPFLNTNYNGRWMGPVTAEDRAAAAAQFTAEQCEAALLVPGLQKSVIAAIKRRQRQLAKA